MRLNKAFLVPVFLIVLAMGCWSCGNGGAGNSRPADSTNMGPAPDNSSAGNSSLADTAYPVKRDSSRLKDSVH